MILLIILSTGVILLNLVACISAWSLAVVLESSPGKWRCLKISLNAVRLLLFFTGLAGAVLVALKTHSVIGIFIGHLEGAPEIYVTEAYAYLIDNGLRAAVSLGVTSLVLGISNCNNDDCERCGRPCFWPISKHLANNYVRMDNAEDTAKNQGQDSK